MTSFIGRLGVDNGLPQPEQSRQTHVVGTRPLQKPRIGVDTEILKEAERVAEGIVELAPPDHARLTRDLRKLDALLDECPALSSDVRHTEANPARPARWHASRELIPHAGHYLILLKVLVENEVGRTAEELSVEAERLCHVGNADNQRDALDR